MKRISTTELAKICGVSQGTVDRALNNRKGISSNTKEKILRVAKEYGYRPNIHASSIAGGKSRLIGVVVFDLKNQYFSDLLTSIENYCSSIGYAAVVMFTDKEQEREIACIQNLYHLNVDGIILCPANNGEAYENFLLSLNLPIVTVGNQINRIPYVGINNTAATRDLISYVLGKQYRRLIYIKPKLMQKNIFAQSERLNSFISICQEQCVDYVITDPMHAEKQIIPNTPCALICPTDIYATKLLPIAQKHKAGIIGFDNIRLIDELNLALDSVAYDIEATAKTSVDYIINGEPVHSQIPYRIVCRGSV